MPAPRDSSTSPSPVFLVLRKLREGGDWSPPERLVALAMADRARWKDGRALAWPGLEKLETATGLSRRTVQRSIARLCDGPQPLLRLDTPEHPGLHHPPTYELLLSDAGVSERHRVERLASASGVSPRHPARAAPAENEDGGVPQRRPARAERGVTVTQAGCHSVAPIRKKHPLKRIRNSPPGPPARAGGTARADVPSTAGTSVTARRLREAALEELVVQAIGAGERPDRRTRRAWRERLASGTPAPEIAREIAQRCSDRAPPSLPLAREPERAAAAWVAVLERVEAKLNRHSFATWFRPTEGYSLDGDVLRVRVPNAMFAEWLQKNYAAATGDAAREAGLAVRVEFVHGELAREAEPEEVLR